MSDTERVLPRYEVQIRNILHLVIARRCSQYFYHSSHKQQ